ncbi:hypothetical protein HPB50_028658 [Hyalomma asiaticum]|nr:hypothetical protein HPB50_028658 [Hyalomma asiaticum]
MAVLSNETPWFMHLATPSGVAPHVLPHVPDMFLTEAMTPKNVDIVVQPWTKVEGLARDSYTGHGRRLFPRAGGDLLVFMSVTETLSQCSTGQAPSATLGGPHQTAVASSGIAPRRERQWSSITRVQPPSLRLELAEPPRDKQLHCFTKLCVIEGVRTGGRLHASKPMPYMGACQLGLASVDISTPKLDKKPYGSPASLYRSYSTRDAYVATC